MAYSKEELDRMFSPYKTTDDEKLNALLKAVFDVLMYRKKDYFRTRPCIGLLEEAYKEFTGMPDVPVYT